MSGIINSAGSKSGVIGSTEIPGGYEEGTYDLAITCSSGTVSLSSDLCRYTKVGRLVQITGGFIVSSVSSPSASTYFSLPFTSGNGSEYSGYSVGVFEFGELNFTGNWVTGRVNNNTAIMQLLQSIDDGAITAVNANGISSSTSGMFSVTYTVD